MTSSPSQWLPIFFGWNTIWHYYNDNKLNAINLKENKRSDNNIINEASNKTAVIIVMLQINN